MNDIKVNALKVLNKMTKNMVLRKNEEWPPTCNTILHQPERPIKKNK